MLFTKGFKSNKGFTLVESVVAITVGSVVITAIALFTMMGVKSFRDARFESMALQESSIVMMPMKDVVKAAVDFKVYEDENMYAFEVLYGRDEEGIYRTYDCAYIYSAAQTDLYVYNAGESDSLGIDFSALNLASLRRSGLISTYVTAFEVTPQTREEAEDDMATLRYTVTVGRSSFDQNFSMRIRNDIPLEEESEEGEEEGD